jgi:hypothetical protein
MGGNGTATDLGVSSAQAAHDRKKFIVANSASAHMMLRNWLRVPSIIVADLQWLYPHRES